MQQNTISKTKMLTVAALCIAIAFLLDQITIFRMPMGGSVSPGSLLLIVLAGYWLGPLYGIVAGIATGFLDLTTGFTNVHPFQVALDYILAFGVLGFAGFFRKMRFGLQIGYVVGTFCSFFMHFLSGIIYFAEYAPEHMSVWGYSAVYNMTHVAPEVVVTLVVISLPAMKHAIDVVTKMVVSPADYAEITAKSKGSVSAAARSVSGALMGVLGGLAFVFSSYIKRLEALAITQATTGAELFAEEPDRLARMVERNTEYIFAFETLGVIFIVIGAALLISTVNGRADS
ncbi:MAG: energy-coupled thiamine transporter ThiT [Defluviitaleaceae bacterium]|nr:energy-coupled thiamine transporter ThiT [Defluviitaleaceae bacterium]